MGYLIGAPKAPLNPDFNKELWSIQANQAEHLAKDMKNRSHGWILEAAGDIFREFTGVRQPDPSYIEEKLSRIEKNWAIKLDRESAIPESDIPLREELLRVYNSMDVKTSRARATVELINKIVDKDTTGITKNIKYIREEIGKEAAKWAKPEIAPKVKEPWEMTEEEFENLPWQKTQKYVRTYWHGGLRMERVPFHKVLVKEALAEGKPVPERVLRDYPDLVRLSGEHLTMESPKTKEPWQMTKEEFIANPPEEVDIWLMENKPPHRGKIGAIPDFFGGVPTKGYRVANTITPFETAHKNIVKYAFKEGKPVPPKVLADYPELAPKAGGKGYLI